MSKPLIRAGTQLKLNPEQRDAAIAGQLKVSFAYKDRRKRRVKKGLLRVYGCPCCGIFADVNGTASDMQHRYVDFTNLFSLFHDRLMPAHD